MADSLEKRLQIGVGFNVDQGNSSGVDKIAQDTKALNDAMEKLAKGLSDFEKQTGKTFDEFESDAKWATSALRVQNRQVTVDYKNSIKERVNAHKELIKAYKEQSSISTKMFDTGVAIVGVRALTTEFSRLGSVIKDINYNTINNQRLMGDYSDTLRDSLNGSAFEIAKNTGILVTDAQEIQGAWIRINDKYKESSELLGRMSEVTAKFMNVSGITDAENAVKLLNSTLLQFNLNTGDVAKNLEEVGNKFAYMADATAMGTADEYAQGIAKMGANVKMMNGNLDDSIVLLSIIGDKLAKNGEEAGNSLNTFTAYMHRTKTLTLFDDLAQQLGDTNLSLREGENGIKNYADSIDTIAEAYRRLKEQGDQIGMNKIIEALGATRQRASAQAILDAISSEDGQNIDYYRTLLEQAEQGGSYLEKQNAILMESMKNQANAMVASFQEAGMALANSGILDVITAIMNGGQHLFEFFASLPEPVMKTVNAMIGFNVVMGGLKKLGAVTSWTDKLSTSLSVGSKKQIEYSQAISSTAQSLMNQEQLLLRQAEIHATSKFGTEEELRAVMQWKTAMIESNATIADLDSQLANHLITTEEYNIALDNAVQKYAIKVGAERQSIASLNEDTIATETNANVQMYRDNACKASNNTKLQSIALDKQSIASKNSETLAENQGVIAKTKAWMAEKANNGVKKSSLLTSIQVWAAKTKETLANNQNTLATGTNTLGTIKNTLAKWGLVAASNAASVAVKGLGFALSVLNPILAAVSIGMTLLSFIAPNLFSGAKEEAEDYSDSLGKLNEALQSGRERVEELKQAQAKSGDPDGNIQKEIDKQNELNKSYEQSIKLLQQKQNYDKYFGDNEDDNEADKIRENIKAIQDYASERERLNGIIERNNKIINEFDPNTATQEQMRTYGTAIHEVKRFQEALTDLDRDARTSAASLTVSAQEIKDMYKDGLINEADWTNKFEPLVTSIESMSNEISPLIETTKEEIQSINDINFDEFDKSLEDVTKQVSDMSGDIASLIDGSATTRDLQEMVKEYEGFGAYIGKSTAEQVAYIRSLQQTSNEVVMADIDTQIEQAQEMLNKATQAIEKANSDNVDKSSDEYIKLQNELDKCIYKLAELQGYKDIQLKVELDATNMDLGDIMNQMESLADSTKSLVEAQNQLANGAALSKEKLWELAMQYPELLYQSQLFADGSVEGQKAAIDAILNMKEQEFNTTVDNKISELEMEREFIQGVLDLEQKKLDILMEGTVEEANGELSVKADLATMLGEYNDVIGEQHTLAEQYKLDKSAEGASGQAEAQDQAGEKMAQYSANAGEAIAQNITEGGAAGAEGLDANAQGVAGIFNKIMGWAGSVARKIANALAGNDTGEDSVGGSSGVGDRANTFNRADYNSGNNTINGIAISDWIRTQQEALRKNIDAYKIQLGGLDNAIANLEAFKKQGISGISNDYSGKGAGGGTGNKKTPGEKEAEKAQKEAEKIAREFEKAANAVERITKEYVKNVENLQDRIAKALKKKYQEQYDERKKLLEKEHEERVQQIQDEIDKINGNTPQDKQSELARLQGQYEKWKKDDSTLGKSKQKEYLDQIEELKKEIKLDELEEQLDKENETYENSIDKDSEFYDKILAKLDKQMTDEALYREASDLIKNQKTQEIIDLLTEYDAKWNGWAVLLGETAGDIIAKEVKSVIANYLDLKNGTITPDGGKETNKVTGGGSTNKPSSGGSSGGSGSASSGGSIGKGRKVKINNTKAGMYYTSTSGGAVNTWAGYTDKYYVVNDNAGRAALSRTNNINGAIGWIDKKYLTGLASGGLVTKDSIVRAGEAGVERVLNAQQTKAFDNLVYSQLPRIEKMFMGTGTTNNNGGITFNKEVMRVDIGAVNNYTDWDQRNFEDNLDTLMRKSLAKSGIRKRL